MAAFETTGKFGGGGGFEPTPEGEHNVAIIGLADMGMCERTYQNKTEMQPMLVLLYSDGAFVHQDWQTFSLWKQSNLAKKIVRATHGGDFDVATITSISEAMLGKLLRIFIEHKRSNDKSYANITNYLPANGKPKFGPDFEFPGALHAWLEKRAEGLVIHPKIRVGSFLSRDGNNVPDDDIPF